MVHLMAGSRLRFCRTVNALLLAAWCRSLDTAARSRIGYMGAASAVISQFTLRAYSSNYQPFCRLVSNYL